MGVQTGPVEMEELEALMREYPDWKEQFPEIAAQLQQPRFHKNRKNNEMAPARFGPRRAVTVPLSDYQASFKEHATRPRSSKRPPPPPPAPLPPPPMSFLTNQREEYVPKDVSVRPQPIVMKENHERPTGPFASTSTYRSEYIPNEIAPQAASHPHFNLTAGQLRKPQGSFDGNTTNKDHYKRWVPQRAMQFKELPTFTGSILYPETGHELQSTTKSTFTGRTTERVGLIRHSYGNIQLEGDHDMNTTTGSTYKSVDGARPAQKIVRQPQMPVRKREAFLAKSQTQADYSDKGGERAYPVQPPPETIELRFDNRTHFRTEQQSQYPGVDVAAHPPPRPIVPSGDTYRPPTSKVEMESRSKSDYKPHDVREAFVPHVRGSGNGADGARAEAERRRELPRFNGETSNSHFYRKWKVEPRRRYVDFHEGHKYMPPRDRFEGTSTTRSTFVGAPGTVSDPYLPVQNSVTGEGQFDFTTMYKAAFRGSGGQANKLSKQQAQKLLTHLRRRKQQESKFTEQPVMFATGVGAN